MATIVRSDTAAYKTYPGGVIALRPQDWLGASRGTLTTEADARSLGGTVVRESQKVPDIQNTPYPFLDAEDTLVIDCSLLPLEEQMFYVPILSFLVDGDWDSADTDHLIGGYDHSFGSACANGVYGDNYRPTEMDMDQPFIISPRKFDTYMIETSNSGLLIFNGDEIIRFRFYSVDGSTISYLLDHIWLIPYIYTGHTPAHWYNSDFAWVSGANSDWGAYYPWVDGADGGDANGKFTLHPYLYWIWSNSDWAPWVPGGSGGSDFQKKSSSASAEYAVRLIADDFTLIADSRKGDAFDEVAVPKAVNCYGVHGAFIIPSGTVMYDQFSRTLYDGDFDGADDHFVGSNWGYSPEGFKWTVTPGYQPTGPAWSTDHTYRVGAALWVDGDRANMKISRDAYGDFRSLYCILDRNASVQMEDYRCSGKFYTEYTIISGTSPTLQVTVAARPVFSFYGSAEITFDAYARTWSLKTGDNLTVYGPVDISSWWAGTSEVAWKIESERYAIRVKVWDASGSEPSSWDYDNYVRLGSTTYPYGDNMGTAWDGHTNGLMIGGLVGAVTLLQPGYTVSFDDIKIEYDLGSGTRTDTHFSMERPDGTEIDQVTIPQGAQQLVYWGKRQWAEWDADNGSVITFSSKWWNEIGAHELQSAMTSWWWFRSVHGGRPPQIIRYR